MHFSNAITAFLAFSLTSAATLKVRDNGSNVATVLGDLAAVNNDIANLQQDVQAYNGQDNQNQALIADIDNLSNKIQGTATDTRNAASFDDADSDRVTNAVNNITPRFATVLNDLRAKANVAAHAGITSQVNRSVRALQTNTDDLFAAVESRVDAQDAGAVRADQQRVDGAFVATIGAF